MELNQENPIHLKDNRKKISFFRSIVMFFLDHILHNRDNLQHIILGLRGQRKVGILLLILPMAQEGEDDKFLIMRQFF